jgi:hypothetical protein
MKRYVAKEEIRSVVTATPFLLILMAVGLWIFVTPYDSFVRGCVPCLTESMFERFVFGIIVFVCWSIFWDMWKKVLT